MNRLPHEDERGDSTLIVIILVTVLFLMIGLVVDGAGKYQSSDEARWTAEQAARAAGQQLDLSSAQAGGQPTVAISSAIAAANDSLAAAGATGSVTSTGNGVQVTVTTTYETVFMKIGGVTHLSSTETATARIARGITDGGS
jgi:Flp pilus assembly protein TadG